MTGMEIFAIVVIGAIVLLFLRSVFGKSRDKSKDGEQGPGPYYGDGSGGAD